MQVDVYTAGELVVLTLGTFGATFHFADALRLSGLLLRDGRVARRVAVGRAALIPAIRASGLLTDATAEKLKPSRWQKPLPEMFKRAEISTQVVGQIVEMKLRGNVAGLPYEAALAIAQHLLIRGQQARNSVNETETWDKLAAVE